MGTRRVDAHLEVVLAAGEVVDDAHVVATARQVQRRRPTEIAIAPEYEDPHACSPLPVDPTAAIFAFAHPWPGSGRNAFAILCPINLGTS